MKEDIIFTVCISSLSLQETYIQRLIKDILDLSKKKSSKHSQR